MNRKIIYAIAAAVAVTGVAETMPQASAAEPARARSLDEVRANVRGEAMTALQAGQLETVGRRWRGGGRRWGGRRYGGGRRWGGRRFYGGRRYSGGRRYYARPYYGRRYYKRRYYRPGVYIGLGF